MRLSAIPDNPSDKQFSPFGFLIKLTENAFISENGDKILTNPKEDFRFLLEITDGSFSL